MKHFIAGFFGGLGAMMAVVIVVWLLELLM